MNASRIFARGTESSKARPIMKEFGARLLAVFIVFAMTLTALPAAMSFISSEAPAQDAPEEMIIEDLAVGPREVKYTISNMFESYLKSTDYQQLGRHGDVQGLNQWWAIRAYSYNVLTLRDKYPFAVVSYPYSGNLDYKLADPRMGYGIQSFYRVSMDASNLATVATGAGMDLQFVPILNPSGLALDGGSMSWNWYVTYLTSKECADITAGSHYANTYYGVPAGAVKFAGAYYNDGEWAELQGKTAFDRAAAAKFLGLTGTIDLRTQFATANFGNALGQAWAIQWVTEGSSSGPFNIYCAYDYSLDLGGADMWLTLDPISTADNLVLRMWGHAWGYEFLMMRMLEGSAGVMQYDQVDSAEDFYLNGTASSTSGGLELRCTAPYHFQAWKDPANPEPAWNLETYHIDWSPNTPSNPFTGWSSRYNMYTARNVPAYHPARTEWAPGTVNFGAPVMYWRSPLDRNLVVGETLQVKLPMGPVVGYEPYQGTSDMVDAAKVAELNSKAIWGELVLGNCYPSNVATYYDNWSKTITFKGPFQFPAMKNPTYPNLNYTGSPNFMFGVSRVSRYSVWTEGVYGGYVAGQTYILRVSCTNVSGYHQSSWDGTVNLKAGGGILGASSHTFTDADNGYWTTTIKITDPTRGWIVASDQWYPYDLGFVTYWGQPTVISSIDSIAPNPVPAGSPVVFSGTATSLDAPIVAYHWVDFEGWPLTELSATEDFTTTFDRVGQHSIWFTATDANGVTSVPAYATVTVTPETPPTNTPPTASFVQPTWGQGGILEPVSFDASGSSDAQDPVAKLQFRWDFENDGVWDTDWSSLPWVSHIYSTSGPHLVALQVKDTGGLTGECVNTIMVQSHQDLLNGRFEKTPTNSSSPATWLVKPLYSGTTTVYLYNGGFKSVVLEIHDVTKKDVKVFQKTVVFSKYGFYPEGGWASFSFSALSGHTYTITLKNFDGPVGSVVDIQAVNNW